MALQAWLKLNHYAGRWTVMPSFFSLR